MSPTLAGLHCTYVFACLVVAIYIYIYIKLEVDSTQKNVSLSSFRRMRNDLP